MSTTGPQPEEFARALLRQLGLSYAEDLNFIARRLGLTIREVDSQNFEGALIRVRGRARGIIAVRRGIREVGRKRFTICHELAHMVLVGHGALGDLICTNPGAEAWDQIILAHEEAADRFASELLLPGDAVREFVEAHGVSLRTARQLGERFCASLTATILKCVSVADTPCAAVVSTGGVISRVKISRRFGHTIQRGRSLRSDTLAWHLTAGGHDGEEEGMVPCDAWFGRRECASTPEVFLRENSILLPYYDKVLTVLTTDAEHRDCGRT